MDKNLARRKIDWALDRVTDEDALDRIYLSIVNRCLLRSGIKSTPDRREVLNHILDKLSPSAFTRIWELAGYLLSKEN